MDPLEWGLVPRVPLDPTHDFTPASSRQGTPGKLQTALEPLESRATTDSMPVLTLLRASLLGLMRTGWLWGVWAVLLFLAPFLLQLRPTAPEGEAMEIARAWAFPAAVLGAGLVLSELEKRAAFLARLSAQERLGAEWGACALAPLYMQLPILLGALLAEPGAALAHALILADILCADLHLAGLALLLLALPMPAAARPLSLLMLVWLLPAWLPSAPLAPLFDLSRAFSPSATTSASLSFGLGFALVAALVRTRAPGARAR